VEKGKNERDGEVDDGILSSDLKAPTSAELRAASAANKGGNFIRFRGIPVLRLKRASQKFLLFPDKNSTSVVVNSSLRNALYVGRKNNGNGNNYVFGQQQVSVVTDI